LWEADPYTQSPTTKCPSMKYDVKTSGLMLVEYPELQGVFEVVSEESGDEVLFDEVLRFTILFVDPESPAAEQKNFTNRFKWCYDHLDISDDARREIENRSDIFTECIFRYFVMISDIAYEQWFAMKMGFHNMTREMATNSIPMNERRMALTHMDQIAQDIERLEDRLFPDENLKRIIAARAAANNLTGVAERYARD